MGASGSKPKLKEESPSLNSAAEDIAAGQFCQKISKDEFDGQRLLGPGGTSENVKELFDALMTDHTLSLEFRFAKLKQFKVEYPFVFREKKGEEALQQVKLALKEKRAQEGNPIVNFFKKKF